MKKILSPIFLLLFISFLSIKGFSQPIDSIRFFTDERVIDMTLTTDIKSLQAQKGDKVFQPASITMRMPDSTVITENVSVGARGKFRRGYCRIPPIMVNFRGAAKSKFNSLGKLKLVIGCGVKADDEQLLLKEFTVYKIYNLLENKSFRVRLVRTNFVDTRNKFKPFTQYSYFIEDDADLANRNGCKKKDHGQVLTESTNRQTMTMVALFEYMIGNTDWSVPNNHNIKLIFEKKNATALPHAVPYDFDYSGLVDASYAVPNEIMGTEKVTERVYRGFPRKMEELQKALAVFRNKKSAILALIENQSLITSRNRKIMVEYLEDFFKIIENETLVKSIFIDGARTS